MFAHAVNLEMGGNLWTLLAAGRDDLPFGIRLAAGGFDAFGLRRGDRVCLRAGLVTVSSPAARLVLDCRTAECWAPARRPEAAPGLAERLGIVAAAANQRAWPGTLPVARAVVSALNGRESLDRALDGAVGCGPGATPSGDDAIVGIFAVLASSGTRGAAAARTLRGRLRPLLASTADISAHLLRQAADGCFSRAVHSLAAALVGERHTGRVREAACRVLDTGASSGADLCMGMLAAAPAFLAHCEEAAA